MATATATAPMPPKTTSQLTSSKELNNQAATAALYVTHGQQKTNGASAILDQNGKLSSASAATSLKYADSKDLPSYPSSGIKDPSSAAGAAASLGWANQKPVEPWRPSASSNASAAALLAADYKAPPIWQPQQSANGAKAALLAHRDTKKVDVWKPETSSHPNSAATIAFNNSRKKAPPAAEDGHASNLNRHGSMLAATGAFAGKKTQRKRSESMPTPPQTYPDQANAATNALRAATSSHAKNRNLPEGGASPIVHMNPKMFTANPPVAPEVDEKRRADVLHASAVAMAKKMYDSQQRQSNQAAGQAAAASHAARDASASSEYDDVQPRQYVNLQEAAQKLAQERLAKLHDEHARNREYREYYGNDDTQVPRSRLSVLGVGRRRSSSESSFDRDREQSARIRSQMSSFSTTLAQVDAEKRKKDRESLMAAAQRNVKASLQGMDEKVYQDTGKVAPSLLSAWELKAHAAAQAQSDTRMEHHGKIDIGGGQFMTQSALDQIAAKNVQPVLDEINAKAEQEHQRQADIQAGKEEKKRENEEQKAREAAMKNVAREQKKHVKDEKEARKHEEKAAKLEQKKAAKAEKGEKSPIFTKFPLLKRGDGAHHEDAAVATAPAATSPSAEVPTTTAVTLAPTELEGGNAVMSGAQVKEPAVPDSPDSPKGDSKVKSWLRTKFGHRLSLSRKNDEDKKGTFEGPMSLSRNGSQVSLDSRQHHNSSMHEVAMAGREGSTAGTGTSVAAHETARDPVETQTQPQSQTAESSFLPVLEPVPTHETQTAHDGVVNDAASEVSALSEPEADGEVFVEARSSFDRNELLPPPKIGSPVSSTRSRGSARNSRFLEEM